MVLLTSNDQNRQACLLQYQMQQRLNQLRPSCFEVRTDALIASFDGISKLEPTISVWESNITDADTDADTDAKSAVRWVISIIYTDSSVADDRFNQQRRFCARLAIADYWLLTPLQSELRACSMPNASSYQQQRLYHVGEQASPSSIPELDLCIQESLPLYFLTRTLKGQRAYESSTLPLRVC
ncbi:MAG: Uma2 family endonuclease [Phormidesmis sp.]